MSELSKADLIANKLNKISEKFAEKISNAQDLIVAGDDLVLDTNSVVNEIESLPAYEFNLDLLPQILNLENMMSDVKYIRESLKENTDLAMKLLKTISGEIEFEPNAELLASYSQLSATLTENMKLFLACYKDVSSILINISKLVKNKNDKNDKDKKTTNITINTDSTEIKSTAELIKQLSPMVIEQVDSGFFFPIRTIGNTLQLRPMCMYLPKRIKPA